MSGGARLPRRARSPSWPSISAPRRIGVAIGNTLLRQRAAAAARVAAEGDAAFRAHRAA